MHLKSQLSFAATLTLGFLLVSNLDAQTRSVTAQEYIQSTSPLANGGSVVSRSAPGQKIQTVTTIAQLPLVGKQPPVTVGYVPKNLNGTSATPSGASNYSSISVGAVNGGGNDQPYAYPTNASATPTSQASLGYYPPNVTSYRQRSTLGLGSAANSPPRTYPGQGVIGRPTGYVNGQPVRNFLRNIFP